MEIKSLFDTNKNIYRQIEKVITYGVSQETRLKAEISEYVVTESIEEQFEKLLNRMASAMEAGGENEVGVWVAGFYGSGKSSFTKYLGLAFDENIKIDGIPFIQHLQDRFKKATTKALLSTVAKRFPAAVLLLDLASEQVAGSTMEEVSTVLYFKVLQWAGYSRNLKVAQFERKLKKENRYDEFLDLFKEQTEGEEWANYRNDDLIVDSLIPEIAHEMYPTLFKTPQSFSTESSEIIRFENDRVHEMIEIAREATGKDYIIFIIDEVGQYVGARPNLILNLDGLAKNLKHIGNGKAWIIATAQQTLTEDDPKASLNSPELYKLKDRFPIQIELEANDIKEICYNRLLGKSSKGEKELGGLFDQYGQQLRHNTKLVDARIYGTDFDRKTFIDLYPFLPAHFDILLHLLGALAKSTGGIGLRSAIKVLQDILVEGEEGMTPIADQAVGWLANTVTLFDTLEKDIRRAFPSLYRSSEKVNIRFPDSMMHQNISKTVCVLQILGNLPITIENVTSLMHSGIMEASSKDKVKNAVEELISDPIVPFGEQDKQLCFFSEKLNDIEQERAKLPLRSVELKRIQNEAIKEAISPLPKTHLNESLWVQTGLKAFSSNGIPVSLTGERNPVQTMVELADPKEYEAHKIELIQDSRQKSALKSIFLLGRTDPKMETLIAEIFRCKEIVQSYRNDADKEVKEYCDGQSDRANRLMVELQRLINGNLVQGSFMFRGEATAVESLNHNLAEAANKLLSDVAKQIFDRHQEAPVRASTDQAEKFLRMGNLTGISAKLDPLGLVTNQSGQPTINIQHKAITSIKDMIERQGSIEGKQLNALFTDSPFGWSQDTLRYLIAAMLLAGVIKLKVAGREVTVNGQQAIDALKNNNSFKSVGVSLRDGRPDQEVLARAAERLTALSGEMVVPLENEISKAATKLFPQLLHDFSPLAEKLKSLELPGVSRLETLSAGIKDILFNDGSETTQQLGSIDSLLHANLDWATHLKQAFEAGLEETLHSLQLHRNEIENLPASGIPGDLKSGLSGELYKLNDYLSNTDFIHKHPELSAGLTLVKNQVQVTVDLMQKEQAEQLKKLVLALQKIPEWHELLNQEQTQLLADVDCLEKTVTHDITGLRELLSQDYNIQKQSQDFKQRVIKLGQDRIKAKVIEAQSLLVKEGKTHLAKKIDLESRISSLQALDHLIQSLQQIRNECYYAQEFELTLKLNDETGET